MLILIKFWQIFSPKMGSPKGTKCIIKVIATWNILCAKISASFRCNWRRDAVQVDMTWSVLFVLLLKSMYWLFLFFSENRVKYCLIKIKRQSLDQKKIDFMIKQLNLKIVFIIYMTMKILNIMFSKLKYLQ